MSSPLQLNSLGKELLTQFRTTGNDEYVCRAIMAYGQAVDSCLSEDTRVGTFLKDFAGAYLARYERFGEIDDLQKAITSTKKAVALTSEGDPKFADCLRDLGSLLSLRFKCTRNVDDLSEDIRNQQQVIQLAPEGHAKLPGWLNNLGISFRRRFKFSGDLEDIAQAIRVQQRCVQLAPEGHPNLPGWLNNLGISFQSRFERTGDLEDISEAIQIQQQVIQLAPEGHAKLPGWLDNLGISFRRRFKCSGDLEDIAQAIRVQQRCVQLAPDGQGYLATWLNKLGISFQGRFERTGDLEDISEAIQIQQRAVQLAPEGHAEFPGWLNYLGISFRRRFERSGDLEDIAQAIRVQQRSIQLAPDGHANLAAWLNNLGISFQSRFKRTGDLEDISEAIRIQQRAVQLSPEGHPNLPGRLNNLGISFQLRFKCSGDLEDIAQAIRVQQHGIQLAPDGHAYLATWLNDLGIPFQGRFERTGDISEATRIQQRAVKLAPDGHPDLPGWLNNLGNSFARHFKATGARESLSTAVLHYRQSAVSLTGPPSIRLIAARKWATISQSLPSSSSEQFEAYACIIQLMCLISGLENTIQHRHETLLNISQLSIAASAAALSFHHSKKAVEWLVQGRCIVWNQINQLRSPLDKLRSHDPALAKRFSVLSRELELAGLRTDLRMKADLSMDAKISLEGEARLHIKHAKDWERLLHTIRDIHGFEDFLCPRKYADIIRGLPKEGPIVVINIHRDRCDALALMAGIAEPIHIPLLKFSYQAAERLADGLRSYLLCFGVRSRIGMPFHNTDSPISVQGYLLEVLDVLWTDVVTPILEELGFMGPGPPEKLPRIWWCPTGPLRFLPIHAAGKYDNGKPVPQQCLSEFVVSSYIPTVEMFDSVKNCCDVRSSGLLIVSQPLTPGMNSLPFARSEAEKIEKQLEMRQISFSTLDDAKATVDCVLQSMEQFTSVHLACHASQNMTDSLNSSIYLHDGPLELSEIMKKNLKNSDFAFMSACQTSKGDERLPEEVFHLASGMLAAGYRSVVGTMWSIFDEHGPDLAELFYKSLLNNIVTNDEPKLDGREAARALHDATQRLQEKASPSFLAWVPYIHIGI